LSEACLPCVEVEPSGPARAAVIWLHGLGADGHDFEPIVPHLGLEPLGVRFVFPHAPRRAVTINMGFVMPAWYDIRSSNLGMEQDLVGLRRSVAQVRDLIARETDRGITTSKIVLAGFSQGGAVALHAGLTHPQPLAGILALSTYLVLDETDELAEQNRRIPILEIHGTEDPMVPFAAGDRTRQRLEQLGYPVEWKSYRMGHEVVPEEIREIGQWLAARLSR
jgi:phospholipase/carboxylesterase